MRTAGSRLYPDLAEYAGREIGEVRFIAAAPFDADTLEELIETEPSHCSLLGLPICLPFLGLGHHKHEFDLEVLRRDVTRLTAFYRRSGFFGTEVRPAVTPLRGEERVEVTFAIVRGDSVVVDTLIVEGTEGILDPDSLAKALPLQPGELFHLGEFGASVEHVRHELQDRGHAYAEVLRNYTISTATNRADVRLTAVPGPRVVIDSVHISGTDNLGRPTVLRQLEFRTGDLLRADALIESQRNLYNLELVQFASVTVAPDSLQRVPGDSSRATVLVQIAESPVHQVEAAAGFGTVDCARLQTRWVSRSFAGGARRLAVTGAVSKIGIGAPVNIGLGKSACRAFEGDVFANELDYRFSADLTQPYFLSPRNHLTLTTFAERQSEPNVFQREAQGGRAAVARRLGARELLTLALDVEHARTAAAPAIFCLALLVCREGDIEELSRPRWRNALGLTWTLDRTDQPVDATRGYVVRSGAAWAARWLASQTDFVRFTAEGAAYRELRPGWVLAGALRFGSFVGTATLEPRPHDFLPPTERFYAGGSNSVRGYERNGLGPGVYVAEQSVPDSVTGELRADGEIHFVPVGGTAVAVTNLELRTPSPFAKDHLRLAFFVDAGALGESELIQLAPSIWRVTPGFGLRLRTPIGPIRLDAAYNPHGPTRAALLAPAPGDGDDEGDLIRIDDSFAPEPGGFLKRFRLHFAVGQAF